jgi:hypothetical protein
MDRRDLLYRMAGHRRRIPITSLRKILPEPAEHRVPIQSPDKKA